jgi:alcohol dehydrogenase (cytochrome c)
VKIGRSLSRAALVGGLAIVLAMIGVFLAPHGIRTRSTVVGLKLIGRLDGVTWSDLRYSIVPHSGFDMTSLAASHSPYESYELPAKYAEDSLAGKETFGRRCAQCHGPDATGGIGPSLVSAAPKRATSDWAMYRVIEDGIPNTPMRPTRLNFPEAWQVIGYLRAEQTRLAAGRARAAARAIAPIAETELARGDSSSDDWVSYAGGFTGQRNKDVPELTEASLRRLRVRWAYQMSDDPDHTQTSPIAVRNLLIVTQVNEVTALDQRDGRVVWKFHRDPPDVRVCCGRGNRGVAVYGDLVYYTSLDAHLFALDLATGRVVWDVTVADWTQGFAMSGAPLVADGKVVVGVAGGEFAARGFLDAYEPETGRRIWRFYTIPNPGEPGAETWPAPRRGVVIGGGGTWVTGAYDPGLKTVYWGTGNPSPDFNPRVRPGSNLYSCSLIALDITTGKLKWSYQFTPNDGHDWDASQQPVLTDAVWHGTPRKLILWANRNGFFYVLDRVSGKFLLATPFVHQTWNDGFDSSGVPKNRPGSEPTPEGTAVYPSVGGATNWWPPAYSQGLGLLYIPARANGSIYYSNDRLEDAFTMITGGVGRPIGGDSLKRSVVAMDLQTGAIRWQADFPYANRSPMGGLLGIGDRLVLGGYGPDFFVLDAATGRRLWSQNLGASIAGSPVVYRTDGQVRLATTAGTVLFVYELAPKDGR